jgi:hypothetical protein
MTATTRVSFEDAREAIDTIRAARRSDDLFSAIERPEDISDCKRTFMDLVRLVHPDVVPTSLRDKATAAHGKLSALYAAHTQSATALEQGQGLHISAVASDDRAYTMRHFPDWTCSRQDSATSEAENSSGAPALVALHESIANCAADLDREARLLTALTAARAPQAEAFFPGLLESLRFEVDGEPHTANALTGYEGTFSLEDIRLRWFRDGLDLRAGAWIWRRLLFALGHAHNAGLVHGFVLPEAIRILPAEHGLVLSDWCHGSAQGVAAPPLPDRASLARHSDFYPSNLFSGETIDPGSDIFMATKTMSWLTKPVDLAIPEVAAFIRGCTLESSHQQPQDAFALLAEFDKLLEELFGPRKFTPLVMPPEARPFASES